MPSSWSLLAITNGDLGTGSAMLASAHADMRNAMRGIRRAGRFEFIVIAAVGSVHSNITKPARNTTTCLHR
jgi:hypothetical protein